MFFWDVIYCNLLRRRCRLKRRKQNQRTNVPQFVDVVVVVTCQSLPYVQMGLRGRALRY